MAAAVELARAKRYSINEACMSIAATLKMPRGESTVLSSYKQYKNSLPSDCEAYLKKTAPELL